MIDAATGQIGIVLYSMTPIASIEPGSLVHISFHVIPGAVVPSTVIRLVYNVAPSRQEFTTELDHGQGQLVLGPGMNNLVVQITGGS